MKRMQAPSPRVATLTGTALLAAIAVNVTAGLATGAPSAAQGANEAAARTPGSACTSDAEVAAIEAYVRAHRRVR